MSAQQDRIQPPFFPIVYLRGYAATMDAIEETVATPYMGFNLGSTKVRQNFEGEIVRFIFESPLLRLCKDHKYKDTYEGGDFVKADFAEDKLVWPRSIWIFRYYEKVSKSLGRDERQTIPEFAEDLREFILEIRDKVCGKEDTPGLPRTVKARIKRDRKRFRVYLVAHSMGGLICRCYLQNLCVRGIWRARERDGETVLDRDSKRNAELELRWITRRRAEDPSEVHLVDKVFTYGTPHNGIDLGGLNAPNVGRLDPFHVRNFNRKVMAEYLNLGSYEKGDPVNSLDGAFPEDRFFCFVGSNYRDYEAFGGLSRKATGALSDGLVMIANATVKDAPRAMAHRSHSGHFGIVNSEEGYQNLRRFLFGQRRVDFKFHIDEITLPPGIQEKVDEKADVRATYYVETTAQVRGANYFLHERKVDQESAIRRWMVHTKTEKRKFKKDRTLVEKPVYLFSGYLLGDAQTKKDEKDALAFSIRVAVQVPLYEIEKRFWFDDHIEGGRILDEWITFHLNRSSDPKVSLLEYGLASKVGFGTVKEDAGVDRKAPYPRTIWIDLGFEKGIKDHQKPRPGLRGRLELTVNEHNA